MRATRNYSLHEIPSIIEADTARGQTNHDLALVNFESADVILIQGP